MNPQDLILDYLTNNMEGSGLYRYRTELYNEWKESDDCVTLEFEMWLVNRIKHTEDALQFAKKVLKERGDQVEAAKAVLQKQTDEVEVQQRHLGEEVAEYRKLYLEYKQRFEFYRDLFDQEQNASIQLKEMNKLLERDVENITSNNRRLVGKISELETENTKLKTELFNQLGIPVYDPKNSDPNLFFGIDLAKYPDSSAEIIRHPKPKKDGSDDTPHL